MTERRSDFGMTSQNGQSGPARHGAGRRSAATPSGRHTQWRALGLAVAAHSALFGVLFFGVAWKTTDDCKNGIPIKPGYFETMWDSVRVVFGYPPKPRKECMVSLEMWSPTASTGASRTVPTRAPTPEPEAAKPTPAPVLPPPPPAIPIPVPPQPAPAPPPPKPVAPPAPRTPEELKPPPKPDLALEREKAAREKLQREKTEREKAEREKIDRAKAEKEKAERLKEKLDREKAEREKAERAEREKAERAEREKAERAEREKADRAAREKAERRARDIASDMTRAQAEAGEVSRPAGGSPSGSMAGASSGGRATSRDLEWSSRMSAAIRKNTDFYAPPEMQGNPQVEFTIELYSDCSLKGVRKTRSSGIPLFDQAVERAIRKTNFPKIEGVRCEQGANLTQRPND